MTRSVSNALFVIIALYAVYAGIMIHDSSFVFEGQRWFCLLDDPMISMRYARNLADGLGLVWNAGERVEGITNPGWTFIMALVHLVEKNRAHTSLYMQVISLLCNIGTIYITARLAWFLSRGSAAVTLTSAATTAFYYPANYWSLYGMETGMLALFITAAVALYIRQTRRQHFPWQSYLILGLATIIRIDAAVPLVVLGGYAIATSMLAKNCSAGFRHFAWLAGTLAIFVGGQTLARLAYYGYPFPNTYYLKMTGFPVLQRMARGMLVTSTTLWYLLWPVAILAAMAIVAAIVRRRSFIPPRPNLAALPAAFQQPLMLLILVFAAQAAYSVYVGGDAWEYGIYCNRYIIVAIPFFMIAFATFIVHLWPRNSHSEVTNRVRPYTVFVVIILCIFALNYRSCWSGLRREIALLSSQPLVQSDNENSIRIAEIFRDTPSNSRIVSDWAGGTFYFLDRYAIDPLGKCDTYIAHLPIPRSHWDSPLWEKAFYPGHMKWDMAYTVDKQKPDYMAFRFGPVLRENRKIITENFKRVPIFNNDIYLCRRINS